MRPQLLVGGLLVALMGAAFYVLEIPLVYFWSLPFALGGGVMMAASFFMEETQGPLRPPEGSKFCAFCTNLMPVGSNRCQVCNGLQPREGG